MLSFFLVLFLFIFNLAPSEGSHVDIVATPPRLLEGFTDHMTLTCDLSNDDGFFKEIISMILTKAGSEDNDNFTEIAAINHLQPDVVTVRDSLSAHVTGHMSRDTEVNITYTWQYPPSEVAGRFLCTVHGMDALGHPVQSQGVARVEEAEFGYDMILDKLREVELQQIAVQTRLNKTEADLNASNTILNATIAELNCTEAELAKMKAQREDLKTAMIVASTTYNNHEYFLSKPQWEGQPIANVQCQVFGGYLAEIDDQQEFDFLNKFLKALMPIPRVLIYISGVDHAAEDKWVTTHSGQPLPFFKWGWNEPNGKATENCMSLNPGWHNDEFLMNDMLCRNYTTETRYMCEIPF